MADVMQDYSRLAEIGMLEAEWDELVSKHGRNYGSSTISVGVPQNVYDRLGAIGDRIRALKASAEPHQKDPDHDR